MDLLVSTTGWVGRIDMRLIVIKIEIDIFFFFH